jgi:hypothetical protein
VIIPELHFPVNELSLSYPNTFMLTRSGKDAKIRAVNRHWSAKNEKSRYQS